MKTAAVLIALFLLCTVSTAGAEAPEAYVEALAIARGGKWKVLGILSTSVLSAGKLDVQLENVQTQKTQWVRFPKTNDSVAVGYVFTFELVPTAIVKIAHLSYTLPASKVTTVRGKNIPRTLLVVAGDYLIPRQEQTRRN